MNFEYMTGLDNCSPSYGFNLQPNGFVTSLRAGAAETDAAEALVSLSRAAHAEVVIGALIPPPKSLTGIQAPGANVVAGEDDSEFLSDLDSFGLHSDESVRASSHGDRMDVKGSGSSREDSSSSSDNLYVAVRGRSQGAYLPLLNRTLSGRVEKEKGEAKCKAGGGGRGGARPGAGRPPKITGPTARRRQATAAGGVGISAKKGRKGRGGPRPGAGRPRKA